jgi:hypothetical protein
MKEFLQRLLVKLVVDLEIPEEMTEEFADKLSDALLEPSKQGLRENALSAAVKKGEITPRDRDVLRDRLTGCGLNVARGAIQAVHRMRILGRPLSEAQRDVNRQLGIDREFFERYNQYRPAKSGAEDDVQASINQQLNVSSEMFAKYNNPDPLEAKIGPTQVAINRQLGVSAATFLKYNGAQGKNGK